MFYVESDAESNDVVLNYSQKNISRSFKSYRVNMISSEISKKMLKLMNTKQFSQKRTQFINSVYL